MKWELINSGPAAAAEEELLRCCGCYAWAKELLAKRPYRDLQHLQATSDSIWFTLSEKDWLEAFRHHPMIGDLNALREKFATTRTWAAKEQAGTAAADEVQLKRLHALNGDYKNRFGFIFIVCATGKSVHEMLAILEARIQHDRNQELKNAAIEQAQITRLRLEKLMKSPITTHVLDTSLGKPARGVPVTLEQETPKGWSVLGTRTTNDDGRVSDLCSTDQMQRGKYRLTFDTGQYFKGQSFYPNVSITFAIERPEEHFHVPLLVSPFGYSTYRGS